MSPQHSVTSDDLQPPAPRISRTTNTPGTADRPSAPAAHASTTTSTSAPHATEAPMAVSPLPKTDEFPTTPQSAPPSLVAVDAQAQGAAGTQDVAVASGAEVGGMFEAVTRPRLSSVRGTGEHYVPPTARYAGELTEGALALRLQAITRHEVAQIAPPSWASQRNFVAPVNYWNQLLIQAQRSGSAPRVRRHSAGASNGPDQMPRPCVRASASSAR